MARQWIDGGTDFEREGAFSRCVVEEPLCFLSGTTGYDYASMTIPAAFFDQATNCMDTIETCLAKADFRFQDIVRVTYILADMHDADTLFAVVRPRFANIRPAIQLFEARLYRPEMKLSIDVIAARQGGSA
jgi:enamine deaminase RidA (YjgF/YER057c/UK114 family)